MLLCEPMVVSLCLALLRPWTGLWDGLVVVNAITPVLGAFGIWGFSIDKGSKIVFSVIYLPLMSFLSVFLIPLLTECAVFRNCL